MDSAHTDTASRLAQLGVPARAIEKHLSGLEAAAAQRAAANIRRAKDRQPLRMNVGPRLPKELTEAELQRLVDVLRAGPAPGQRWWWRTSRSPATYWIGHAVARATGRHCSEGVVRTALTQLQQQRLAHPERGAPPNRYTFFAVAGPPPAPAVVAVPLPPTKEAAPPPPPPSFEQRLATAESRADALVRERLPPPPAKVHRERLLARPKVVRERLWPVPSRVSVETVAAGRDLGAGGTQGREGAASPL